MNTDLRVVFFTHPRSGGSSLFQILQLHPDLHLLEEPFNEGFVDWHPGNKNYRELIHDIPSLDVQLEEIFATYNGLKVCGYQLSDELNVHLLQRPDCQIIFLRRRNVLQAVVSVLIAEQTQLWKKWDQTRPLEDYYRGLRPLDITDVQQRVVDLKQHLDFVERVIDARPDGAIKLVYEDLYFAPQVARDWQIDAISEALGLAPLKSERLTYYLRPETVKINSPATYALLPNAREIEANCGDNVTGWLFEEPRARS